MNKVKQEYYKLIHLMLLNQNPLYNEKEWKWYVVFALSIMEAWLMIGVFSIINWITGFDLYALISPDNLLKVKLIVYSLNILIWFIPVLFFNFIIIIKGKEFSDFDYRETKNSKLKIILFFIMCGGLPIIVFLLRNL